MSSKRSPFSLPASLACAFALTLFGSACDCGQTNPCGEDEDCEDGGALPPDFCDSQAEADSDSEHCHLTVNDATGDARKTGVYISRLLDGGVDRDWYLAKMPSGLGDRSLLHVNAGYQVPQTAVNFSVNVLTAGSNGALTSIAAANNDHGAAAPKPVDIVIPFGTSGANVYLLVGDNRSDAQHQVDNRNPYSVFVQVMDNPDTNEPNDTTPTVIPLTNSGAEQSGSVTGYLATTDDKDLYSVEVGGSGNRFLYLHITESADHPTNPPPPYKLGYRLLDSQGNSVSEGHMENEFLTIDLATSRVTTGRTGTWRLEVMGYKAENSNEKIAGDLRIQYKVDVRLLPDLDTYEPNDTLATAKSFGLSGPGTTQIRGKLSTVPDEEWFVLNVPSGPATLRYKLTVAAAGGRFEPLGSGQRIQGPNRYLRILKTLPSGGTSGTCTSTKYDDRLVCHKSYSQADDIADEQKKFVAAWCNPSTQGVPPLCLYSQRWAEQDPPFANMKNVVGTVPVPAEGGTYYIVLRDEGQGVAKYADDRDWTIDFTWANDADEAGRPAENGPKTLGVTTNAEGEISFGYGAFVEGFNPNHGEGIRGSLIKDYDAYESDEDLYEFTWSSTGPLGWLIEWDMQHPMGGVPPGELVFEVTFCTGASTGGGEVCQGAHTELLGYNAGEATPWYLPMSSGNATHLFTRTDSATVMTTKAEPVGCWCFSDTRAASGHFFLNVRGANRVSNDPIRYTIKQSVGTYPEFPSSVCPGNAGVDAGGVSSCGFAP